MAEPLQLPHMLQRTQAQGWLDLPLLGHRGASHFTGIIRSMQRGQLVELQRVRVLARRFTTTWIHVLRSSRELLPALQATCSRASLQPGSHLVACWGHLPQILDSFRCPFKLFLQRRWEPKRQGMRHRLQCCCPCEVAWRRKRAHERA